MSYDGGELFWKNLYTKEDMMSKIVWGAKNEQDFNASTQKEADRIIDVLKLKELERGLVIDFGCGIGRLVKYIAQNTNHIIGGVDVSQPMINQAKDYCAGTDCVFTHMRNGFTLPVADDCASAIYSHIVLQHIHKYKVWFILKEFYRILKPGHKAFIQLPELCKNMHMYEVYATDYVMYDEVQMSQMNFWTREEISLVLNKLGFIIKEGFSEGTDMFVLFEKPEVKK